ncbi:MAG TPA: FGGY family carbohydrate kinase [Ilumatobacteraceae bacterium]|nr:FGGY family carbohydrate kinase [Ilumatobacteraceae bacterium]
MTVLAIDQGTSATKAVVVSAGGEVLSLAEASIRVVASPDGAVELDPEELWQSVLAAGREAMSAAGNPTLAAIGLANQGETVMAWDRTTGVPSGPAIVWQDRRSEVICDRLREHADFLAEHTGLQLDPYFVAPKMVWLQELIGEGLTITTTDTWMLSRMCGAFATDVATAGRSLLLDLDTAEWSNQACEIFGIDPATLPTVVGNADKLGDCDLFGPSVPVTGTCVDQQAALFAEHCREAGEAKCTYGTGAFMLACTGDRPTRSTNGLVGCPAWRIGPQPTYCLDGQVYTVGAAVTWLIHMGIISEPADLDRVGDTVDAAGGVTFVPALAGLAAPYWKPQAKAAFTGLTLGTERGHLVRAAIEGIAAQVALLAQAAGRDLGTPLTRLRVDGGLTRSRLLLQTQADLLQAPVEVYPSPHATALGVAAFADLGASGVSQVQLAASEWHPDVVVEPRIGSDEAAARLAGWHRVATATMDL